MIINLCRQCGKQFEAQRWQIRKGHGIYCTRACAGLDGSILSAIKNAQDAKSRRVTIEQPKDHRLIALNRGVSLVDIMDYEVINKFNWSLTTTGYARRVYRLNGTCKQVRMHRYIVEKMIGRSLKSYEVIDHINHNRLDNRRKNLKVVTVNQNNYNSGKRASRSSLTGVIIRKSGRAAARITVDGLVIGIGTFEDAATAGWMRDQWALGIHGSDARLNFKYTELPERVELTAPPIIDSPKVCHA